MCVGHMFSENDEELVRVVSAPSSLRCLVLCYPQASLSPLCHNHCLTSLGISLFQWSGQYPHIVKLLGCNNTLQHLALSTFNQEMELPALQAILRALEGNSTLLSLRLEVNGKPQPGLVTLDPRVTIESNFRFSLSHEHMLSTYW